MLRVLVTIGGMQVAAMAAVLLRTKGLALLLGPGDVGIMAVIDKLIAMVSQTASLSLPFAALRFLPSLKNDPDEFARLRRAMALVVVGLSAVAAAGTAGIALVHPSTWGAELANRQTWLVIGLLTVPILSVASFLPNAFAGGLDHRGAMTFTVAHAVALSASGLLGAWLGGVKGVYLAYLVLGGALVVSRLVRLSSAPSSDARSPFHLPTAVWRFGVAMLGLAWVVPYAALYTHYQVLRYFGANVSGYMQAAMGLAIAVRTVLGSGHQFFLTPHVNRTGAPADRLAWAVQYQRTLALLVGVLTPPLLLGADIAVRVLYSKAFLPAAPYAWMFVMVEMLTLFAGTYQSLILAFDHLRYHVVLNLLSQGAILALAFTLIPRYGVVGAALAPIGGQTVIWIGTLLFLRTRFALRVPRDAAFLTAASIASVAIAGIAGAHLSWTAAGVGVRIAVWVSGLLLLWALADRTERAKFTAVFAKGPRQWAADAQALIAR